MTSLDVLTTTDIPYLHLCLLVAFLFFSFSHLKFIIVPVLQKQVAIDDEEFEPEDTFEIVDETTLVDVEKTPVEPVVAVPVVESPPKPEGKPSKKNKKKNKKKKAGALPQTKAPASPTTFNLSDDESSVGPSFGSDSEQTNSKSPPPSPVKSLPVTPPTPPNNDLLAVSADVVQPIVAPVVGKKSAKINAKSALLRRIAAQLRLRVRNKSKGFDIDYSTFAIIPSTVNIPFGCKVAESEFFRNPFDENAPISPVLPQHRIQQQQHYPQQQQQQFHEQQFANPMNLGSSSPSSLKAFAPVFVPKQPSPIMSIRPLAFGAPQQQQQQPLLATPQPQQMSQEDMAALLETQMNDNQMDPPENNGEGGEGGISECIPVLCKYGNTCSRAGCHFMHSMRPSVIRKCKYDNLCIRTDCHFSHPNGRPLLKAKPRTVPRRPKHDQRNQPNSLGLPPGDLAARVMSLAALGYNVSQHLQPGQHTQRNVVNRPIPTIRSC